MTELEPQSQNRPRLTGPKRRWLVLLAWGLCLIGALAGQRLAVGAFPTGYWTPDGGTPATPSERIWYLLSPTMVVAFSVLFFVGSKWLVPEEGTRGMIRAWGCFLAFLALLVSLGMSCCFNLIWYMD